MPQRIPPLIRRETDIDASYAINRDGPAYLAEAARQVGAVLLHISTDYVLLR